MSALPAVLTCEIAGNFALSSIRRVKVKHFQAIGVPNV
jgi:hypothetical protein